MLTCFTQNEDAACILLEPVLQDNLQNWLFAQSEFIQSWVKSTGFAANPSQVCLIPSKQKGIERVIFGIDKNVSVESFGHLPTSLPPGIYRFVDSVEPILSTLGWGMGAYVFTKYRQPNNNEKPQLFISHHQREQTETLLDAIYWVRDLINTPTEDMGPEHLSNAFLQLAQEMGAQCNVIVGEDLLTENYPAIHCVGRAGQQHPRLIDLTWGEPGHPKITLVGKGVCFDSGGLDLKTSSGMLLMKKDMGGAAHVLGLAKLLMAHQCPIRLRVLVPAVENAVSGNAYRPGDVIRMRSGKTVEVGNTDAEGRLVLADALTEACHDNPDLIIDMATLTGAARVALGPDIPIFFTPSDEIAHALMKSAQQQKEAIWRLPLHAGYRSYIDSNIADINNNSSQPYAGAITAALFLQEFVTPALPWIHFDLMAWNIKSSPAHPVGGEAMALRTVFDFIVNKLKSPL